MEWIIGISSFFFFTGGAVYIWEKRKESGKIKFKEGFLK